MTDRKPYRPSNGTDGSAFEDRFCDRCRRECGEYTCEILTNALAFPIDSEMYPVEWIYDADNRPCCTAFEDVGDPDGLSVVDDRTADLFGGAQ